MPSVDHARRALSGLVEILHGARHAAQPENCTSREPTARSAGREHTTHVSRAQHFSRDARTKRHSRGRGAGVGLVHVTHKAQIGALVARE